MKHLLLTLFAIFSFAAASASASTTLKLPSRKLSAKDGSKTSTYSLTEEMRKLGQAGKPETARLIQVELRGKARFTGATVGLMVAGVASSSATFDDDSVKTIRLRPDETVTSAPWELAVRGELEIIELKVTVDVASDTTPVLPQEPSEPTTPVKPTPNPPSPAPTKPDTDEPPVKQPTKPKEPIAPTRPGTPAKEPQRQEPKEPQTPTKPVTQKPPVSKEPTRPTTPTAPKEPTTPIRQKPPVQEPQRPGRDDRDDRGDDQDDIVLRPTPRPRPLPQPKPLPPPPPATLLEQGQLVIAISQTTGRNEQVEVLRREANGDYAVNFNGMEIGGWKRSQLAILRGCNQGFCVGETVRWNQWRATNDLKIAGILPSNKQIIVESVEANKRLVADLPGLSHAMNYRRLTPQFDQETSDIGEDWRRNDSVYYVESTNNVHPARIIGIRGDRLHLELTDTASRIEIENGSMGLARTSGCAQSICVNEVATTVDRRGNRHEVTVLAIQSTRFVVVQLRNGMIIGNWPVSSLNPY